MRAYTFDEMKKLVKDNNKSRIFSDEFVVCLIWKESGFRAAIKNAKTSATGLMQLTIAAVQMVNGCSPQGVHFEHSDMTDAAKNIQCGTYYLDIAKTKLNGVDKSFGTGDGYSKTICACEKALASDGAHPQVALHKIHD